MGEVKVGLEQGGRRQEQTDLSKSARCNGGWGDRRGYFNAG